MFSHGFQDGVLLLFTVLIWTLYLLIYFSSPKNKVNQWCCICGFMLSIGVLKEYIYFSGMLDGIQVKMFSTTYQMPELMNSILTAVLYYLAMPCVMIFSFYFCQLDKIRPRLFHVLTILVFLPVLGFCVAFPWSQTREIPKTNPQAYVIVAVYNLSYGLMATVPIVWTLIKERKNVYFRQRRLVSVIALLPLWYWLITLFLFHLLHLEKLYKLWQGNALIVVGLFFYYLHQLFQEGVWGMRLNREYFDWSGEVAPVPENTRYVVHMLKNETAKLEWCSRSIRELNIPESFPELDIIDHSISHIEEFVRRSSLYSGEIQLEYQQVDMQKLFKNVAEELTSNWGGKVVIHVEAKDKTLYCDLEHIKEVLCNLVLNAIDAMGDEGTLTLSYQTPGKKIALIRVLDTGPGIEETELSHIFDLYYTGYANRTHMGLGLPYCRKIIRAHRGYIQVKSQKEDRHGTVFTLCLPRGTKERRGKHGNSDKNTDCGG